MQLSLFFQSKYFRWTVRGIVVFAIILIVFQLGVYVGFRKARFSYRWADNYHRMFGGPRGGFMRDISREFSGRDFMNAHGVVGAVMSVAEDGLVIRGVDDVEKDVRIAKDTIMKRGRETLVLSDFLTGDRVIIMGSPSDNGTIDAKMIRLLDDASDAPRMMRGFGFSR